MAQSRLERIGTIFFRVSSLIEGGAMKPENVPLWYKVYQAFPPKYEPYFSRPPSEKPIKNIFYEEDLIRAKLHQQITKLPPVNLNSSQNTATQTFLELYAKHQETGLQETDAYEKAMIEFNVMFPSDQGKEYQSKNIKIIEIPTKILKELDKI